MEVLGACAASLCFSMLSRAVAMLSLVLSVGFEDPPGRASAVTATPNPTEGPGGAWDSRPKYHFPAPRPENAPFAETTPPLERPGADLSKYMREMTWNCVLSAYLTL